MDGNETNTLPGTFLTQNKTLLKLSNLYWSWQPPQNSSVKKIFVNPSVKYNNGVAPDWDYLPLVPVLATIMLAATVFLLVIFRQSPALVAATIAACLTIISIYLLLSTIEANRVKYE